MLVRFEITRFIGWWGGGQGAYVCVWGHNIIIMEQTKQNVSCEHETLHKMRFFFSFVIHFPYLPFIAVRYHEKIRNGSKVMERI